MRMPVNDDGVYDGGSRKAATDLTRSTFSSSASTSSTVNAGPNRCGVVDGVAPGFYETDGISLAVVSIPVPVIRHFCATHPKLEEHIMKYLLLINTPSPDSAE